MLPVLTVEGRLTADPELRYTGSGMAVVKFSIVCNDRKKDDNDTWVDVNPTFFRCTAFKQLAENIAESYTKGKLVIVVGKQHQEEYQKDGEKKVSYQNITVNATGPSLAFATVQIKGADRGSGDAAPAPVVDPWANPASADSGAPPF